MPGSSSKVHPLEPVSTSKINPLEPVVAWGGPNASNSNNNNNNNNNNLNNKLNEREANSYMKIVRNVTSTRKNIMNAYRKLNFLRRNPRRKIQGKNRKTYKKLLRNHPFLANEIAKILQLLKTNNYRGMNLTLKRPFGYTKNNFKTNPNGVLPGQVPPNNRMTPLSKTLKPFNLQERPFGTIEK